MSDELDSIQPPPAPEPPMNGFGPLGFKHSSTLGKLTAALAKAASEFQPIKKETQNPFFKSTYADLAALIDGTRNALSKNELVVIQIPRTSNETSSIIVTTALIHSSDEWISCELDFRPKSFDPQGCGSAMTYARRYAYQSILNIAGEADDDGNAATGKGQSGDVSQAASAFNERTNQTRSSPALVLAFEKLFANSGKSKAELSTRLQTRYSASSPSELTKDELGELVKWAASVPVQETLKPTVPTHNWKRLYAQAREKQIEEDEIKSFYTKKFKVKSGTELTDEQFAALEKEVGSWNGPEVA